MGYESTFSISSVVVVLVAEVMVVVLLVVVVAVVVVVGVTWFSAKVWDFKYLYWAMVQVPRSEGKDSKTPVKELLKLLIWTKSVEWVKVLHYYAFGNV